MDENQIRVFYSSEDNGFIAEIPQLKFCSAFGKTREEALLELRKAEVVFQQTAKRIRGSSDDSEKQIRREKFESALRNVPEIQPEPFDEL